MQWDDLRMFLAVARDGSISGAARRLAVQHSTVSRRVRALEDKLGTRLIERRKSGQELTAAGEELMISASNIEREVLAFEGALGGQDELATGGLTVSAINNMASTVLMPMLARFSEAYPEIELHVQVSNRFVSLAERHADIAIRLTNSPLETLIGTRLITVASAVYGARSYLARLRAEKGAVRWLGIECCAFHQSWTRAARSGQKHNFFVDDTLLTLAALKQGVGVAYLPCFMGDVETDLERLFPPDPVHDLGLWLLYHPDLRRIKRVRVFRRHMLEQIGARSALFEGRQPMHVPAG